MHQQNSLSPVFADLLSHLEHVNGFCVSDSSTLANDLLHAEHTDILSPVWVLTWSWSPPFRTNLLWHVGQGNGFSSVWTLSCNSSPLVCANFFSHSEHEKCCQLNDFMFALFTRVWFLSCVCFSVLLIHWILCSIVILTKNIHHFISFLTDSRNLFKKSVH